MSIRSQLDKEGAGRLLVLLLPIERELGLPLLLTLLAIAHKPGLSVNELAERINVPQQTASRYVASLQGRYDMPGREIGPLALVNVEISQLDPRRRSLYLTPAGEKRLLEAQVALDDLRKG